MQVCELQEILEELPPDKDIDFVFRDEVIGALSFVDVEYLGITQDHKRPTFLLDFDREYDAHYRGCNNG